MAAASNEKKGPTVDYSRYFPSPTPLLFPPLVPGAQGDPTIPQLFGPPARQEPATLTTQPQTAPMQFVIPSDLQLNPDPLPLFGPPVHNEPATPPHYPQPSATKAGPAAERKMREREMPLTDSDWQMRRVRCFGGLAVSSASFYRQGADGTVDGTRIGMRGNADWCSVAATYHGHSAVKYGSGSDPATATGIIHEIAGKLLFRGAKRGHENPVDAVRELVREVVDESHGRIQRAVGSETRSCWCSAFVPSLTEEPIAIVSSVGGSRCFVFHRDGTAWVSESNMVMQGGASTYEGMCKVSWFGAVRTPDEPRAYSRTTSAIGNGKLESECGVGPSITTETVPLGDGDVIVTVPENFATLYEKSEAFRTRIKEKFAASKVEDLAYLASAVPKGLIDLMFAEMPRVHEKFDAAEEPDVAVSCLVVRVSTV
jgi:hypothetical protein